MNDVWVHVIGPILKRECVGSLWNASRVSHELHALLNPLVRAADQGQACINAWGTTPCCRDRAPLLIAEARPRIYRLRQMYIPEAFFALVTAANQLAMAATSVHELTATLDYVSQWLCYDAITAYHWGRTLASSALDLQTVWLTLRVRTIKCWWDPHDYFLVCRAIIHALSVRNMARARELGPLLAATHHEFWLSSKPSTCQHDFNNWATIKCEFASICAHRRFDDDTARLLDPFMPILQLGGMSPPDLGAKFGFFSRATRQGFRYFLRVFAITDAVKSTLRADLFDMVTDHC
jgi:hypothetical protein